MYIVCCLLLKCSRDDPVGTTNPSLCMCTDSDSKFSQQCSAHGSLDDATASGTPEWWLDASDYKGFSVQAYAYDAGVTHHLSTRLRVNSKQTPYDTMSAKNTPTTRKHQSSEVFTFTVWDFHTLWQWEFAQVRLTATWSGVKSCCETFIARHFHSYKKVTQHRKG